MAVASRRVPTRSIEVLTTGHVSVLDVLGGPPMEIAATFPTSSRGYIGELITQLRVICGALVPGPIPRGFLVGSAGGWRSLRETNDAELAYCFRRVQRAYPEFVLPGSDSQPTLPRIEHLLQSGAPR